VRGPFLGTCLIFGFGALSLAVTAVSAETVPYDCVIEPHAVVELSSSEIGVLSEVLVEKADPVRKGERVAALRTDVERATLALSLARSSATGELAVLRETLRFNARRRERTEELHRTGVVSNHDADEIRTNELLASLRLSQAAEKYELAGLQAERERLALERRIVTSPFDGVVIERFKSAGEYVDGDTIIKVAQVDPLRIELLLPISMYGAVAPGMRADVQPEIDMPGPHLATVTRVDPVIDAATATFGVRLSLPNQDRRLPAGQKCTLSLLDPPPRAAPVADGDPPYGQSDELTWNSCQSLGPIRKDQLAHVEQTLESDEVYLATREVRKPTTTIVISSSPAPSDGLARARERGVEHVGMIHRGTFAGHLSYGVYSKLEMVAARLGRLEQRGISAEAKPLGGGFEYWLDLFGQASPAALPGLLAEFPTLRVVELPCGQLAAN